MSDTNEEYPVQDYFDQEVTKADAIGLIARIDPKGNIKSELNSKLGVTEKTVRRLLDDAIEADLIEQIPVAQGDHGQSDRYVLTHRGEAVQAMLKDMGFDEIHAEYTEGKHVLQQSVPELKARVQSEGLHTNEYRRYDSWERDQPIDTEQVDEADLIDNTDNTEDDSEDTSSDTEPPGEQVTPEVINESDEDEAQSDDTEIWGETNEETD